MKREAAGAPSHDSWLGFLSLRIAQTSISSECAVPIVQCLAVPIDFLA